MEADLPKSSIRGSPAETRLKHSPVLARSVSVPVKITEHARSPSSASRYSPSPGRSSPLLSLYNRVVSGSRTREAQTRSESPSPSVTVTSPTPAGESIYNILRNHTHLSVTHAKGTESGLDDPENLPAASFSQALLRASHQEAQKGSHDDLMLILERERKFDCEL